uniref:Uncharacterized protein n=1 Tax=Pristionchus pacificus TaxID=54126 RepID=A0A2A6BT04_PRIPA|eukprot:PDM69015.1 hypothetical protein PRIPAC_47317 [Pristionchus pacificus]
MLAMAEELRGFSGWFAATGGNGVAATRDLVGILMRLLRSKVGYMDGWKPRSMALARLRLDSFANQTRRGSVF